MNENHEITSVRAPRSSAIVAILFALFVNQGVLYYIQRFSLEIEFLSPWPVLLATLAFSAIALVSTKIDVGFIRVSLWSLTVCTLYAITYLWSPSGEYGFQKTLLTLFIPALCIAAGYVVARDGRLQLLFVSFAILAALTAIVFTVNGHTPTLFAQDERARTVIITYHNFAFIMALGAIWAINRLERRLPNVDVWSFVCLLLFMYFILLSGGRIGLLLVLLAILTFVWSGTHDRLLAAVLIASCFLILGVLALVVQSYANDIANHPEVPATLKRMVYYAFLQREGNVAAGTRDIFYNLALDVFLQAPLVGVGWGGFPISAGLTDLAGNWPHNLVLELLSETGLVGAMIFLLFLALVLYEFTSAHGKTEDKNIVLVIFLAGFVSSMIGGDWPSQRLLFFSLGAMTGFAARYAHPIGRESEYACPRTGAPKGVPRQPRICAEYPGTPANKC